MPYQDTVSIGDLLDAPNLGVDDIMQMVASQSPQVAAVDWIFRQVTGISLVETIITPIAGDWTRAAGNGQGWRSAAAAIEAISRNLDANVDQLQSHWTGAASQSFGNHVKTAWAGALAAEAGLARLLGEGFETLAEESKKLCKEVLDQLEKLVNKLIEAIATIWVPFAGWARAVELVWEAFRIFKAIMDIINSIKGIIEAAKALFEAVSQIKSALEAIPDVRSFSDAMQVAQRITAGMDGAARAVDNVNNTVDRLQQTYGSTTPRTTTVGTSGTGR